MLQNLGIMQGRLVNREIESRMQSFPVKNWKKEFKYISDIKLNKIEWTIDFKRFLKNPINTNHGQKEIIKLKKKFSVKIPSITADFFMQKPYFKKKYVKYENKILNFISTLIINSSKIGVKFIILPLVDKSSIKNKNQEIKIVSTLKKFTPLLKKKKIQILFESDFKPKRLLKFIKYFNKDYFGINYDSGNSANLNFHFDEEMIYYNFIKNIHLKDRKINGSSKSFGSGDTDFFKLFSYLKAKNYNGNLILQSYLPKYKDPKKEFKHNLNFIKKIIYSDGKYNQNKK